MKRVLLKNWFLFLLIAIFGGLFFVLEQSPSVSQGSYILNSILPPLEEKHLELTQEELVDLVKPSVVRVVQEIKGEAVIPDFDIDFKKKSVVFLFKNKPINLNLDQFVQYITGSGFVINPDGIILTNAHVVSDESIKRSIVGELVGKFIILKSFSLKESDVDKGLLDDAAAATNFVQKIISDVIEKSAFNITKKLVVLNPFSTKEKIADLLFEGFPARVVFANDSFWKDDKDIAFLRIDEKNLPSIKWGDASTLTTGRKIYVFGFPATAEFNRKNLIESTFTSGAISSLKDSQNKDFKIFQTDAKVSEGSSGGPLLNDKGEAAGVITFQTGTLDRESGDNFAFAIPIDIAKKIAGENVLANESGSYRDKFLSGLALMRNRKCGAAISEFEKAKETNGYFSVAKLIDPYIEKCKEIAAAGESIDTAMDELRARLNLVPKLTWTILGGALLVIAVLVLVIFVFRKKLRKEEEEIHELEHRFEERENGIEKNVKKAESGLSRFIFRRLDSSPSEPQASVFPSQKIRAPEPVNPALAKYVSDGKKAGLSDEYMFLELKKAGWQESEIRKVLRI